MKFWVIRFFDPVFKTQHSFFPLDLTYWWDFPKFFCITILHKFYILNFIKCVFGLDVIFLINSNFYILNWLYYFIQEFVFSHTSFCFLFIYPLSSPIMFLNAVLKTLAFMLSKILLGNVTKGLLSLAETHSFSYLYPCIVNGT